jgi:hypothetical protein
MEGACLLAPLRVLFVRCGQDSSAITKQTTTRQFKGWWRGVCSLTGRTQQTGQRYSSTTVRLSMIEASYLINEDDGGCLLPGHGKQLAHQLLTLSQPFADQVLTGDGKKSGLCLCSHSLARTTIIRSMCEHVE